MMRKNKKFQVSNESAGENPEKRTTKFNHLKDRYDYCSQISTLPITGAIRDETKTADLKKNAPSKEKYDIQSAIQTLPGSLNNRVDKKPSPTKTNEHQRKRYALTGDETFTAVTKVLCFNLLETSNC
jgi:hypothetical protein